MPFMKIADKRQRLVGLMLLALLWGAVGTVVAQDTYYAPSTGGMKQMHDSINQIKHSINNHESELRQVDEKFNSLESIIEGMGRQLQEHAKHHKDQLQVSKASLEAKIGDLELVTKGLLVDINQIRNRVNESNALLSQFKLQMAAIEKSVEVQNHNIENLHAAMKTLTQVLQGGEISEAAGDVYVVKSGDSLEKIAHAHSTSVKALKEFNALVSDRIKIGQKLKIPSK